MQTKINSSWFALRRRVVIFASTTLEKNKRKLDITINMLFAQLGCKLCFQINILFV